MSTRTAKLIVFSLLLLPINTLAVGCGGVSPGVADAPAEPEPELTEEEAAGEEAYTSSSDYQAN